MSRPEHHQHTTNVCPCRDPVLYKMQSVPNKAPLAGLHDVLVPHLRVRGSRLDKTHTRCAFQGFRVSLPYPLLNILVVWRVHPNDFTAPIPVKAIVLLGEVSRAFGILRGSASVKCEPKLPVKGIKKALWGFPFNAGHPYLPLPLLEGMGDESIPPPFPSLLYRFCR